MKELIVGMRTQRPTWSSEAANVIISRGTSHAIGTVGAIGGWH